MMNLLKNVGKGILYIIGLPFFLIVLALTAVFGIFVLIFTFIKSILFFFTGRSLNDELPEDRQARKIKERQAQGDVSIEPVNNTAPIVNQTPTQPVNQTVQEKREDSISIEEAVFGQPQQEEIVQEEKPVEETIITEEEEVIPPPPVNRTIEKPKEAPKPRRTSSTIGQYIPPTDNARVINDYEEEEETDGVTITFGDGND